MIDGSASLHDTPEAAGEALAERFVGGPTPWEALLYRDGAPAPKADALRATAAAAEAVAARGNPI